MQPKKITSGLTVQFLILIIFCLVNPVYGATDTWHSNDDFTVTDVATGLIWQQFSSGTTRTHEITLSYCENLNWANNTDWRVPNIKELISIVDYESDNPSINSVDFLNALPQNYWSSTSQAGSLNNAWYVDFKEGKVFEADKTERFFVRCVR